jgi:hypothetical protein
MSEALDRYREERRVRMNAAVTRAMRDLERANSPINISRVAAAAGVSRQWLYDSPFRAEIEARRERSAGMRPERIRPACEAATEASLRSQVEALRERLSEFRRENTSLRRELERALGMLRDGS